MLGYATPSDACASLPGVRFSGSSRIEVMVEASRVRSGPDAFSISFDGVLIRVADRWIVKLPAEASAKLPSRGQVAVLGAVNQRPFTTVVEPDGVRGHWLDVAAIMKSTLPVNAGDVVRVDLEPTRDWPEPHIPDDLRSALAEAPDTAEIWADITPMARWEWVRWINATRNPQTRQRRVEVTISKLRRSMRRPCCFDLAACTDPQLSMSGKLIGATPD